MEKEIRIADKETLDKVNKIVNNNNTRINNINNISDRIDTNVNSIKSTTNSNKSAITEIKNELNELKKIINNTNKFVDTSNYPGDKVLREGNRDCGYFGEVSANNFLTAEELFKKMNYKPGEGSKIINNNTSWFKCIFRRIILYIAKYPILYKVIRRDCPHSINISLNGLKYFVRTLRGTYYDNIYNDLEKMKLDGEIKTFLYRFTGGYHYNSSVEPYPSQRMEIVPEYWEYYSYGNIFDDSEWVSGYFETSSRSSYPLYFNNGRIEYTESDNTTKDWRPVIIAYN